MTGAPFSANLTRSAEAHELAKEIRSKISGEVRFDRGTRALYAADLSIYRQVPIGIVIPHTPEDVITTVAACRGRGVPILGRGCGTSLAGQCCNVAVIIDFSKFLNRIVELNPDERFAWVEPGVICDQLRNAAEEHHLTFAPDPATHEYCTLGGMIGNNSCGAHSVMGGKTVDNVEELEVLTYDGVQLRVGKTGDAELQRLASGQGRVAEIYRQLRALRDHYSKSIAERYPPIPRRVSGYNLDELLPQNGFDVARALVGSESTCALVMRAKIRLIPSPPKRSLLVAGYPDAFVAANHVTAILEHRPTALEAVDHTVVDNMARKGKPLAGASLLPEGRAWLLVEFGGDSQQEATARANDAMAKLRPDSGNTGMKVFDEASAQTAVWNIRESGVGASRIPGVEDAWPGWEDAAVAPERLGGYLREFVALLRKHEYPYTLYGHFGQGCVHARIAFDTKTVAGVKKYRRFMEEASDLVLSYNGSLSGEHGDGQARAEFLPKMFGSDLVQAFGQFKTIWDPDRKMNPGKLVDPYPLDSNLRVGPDYAPAFTRTHFQFPQDQGSMAAATERCFGVGKCRRTSGGTMCPSFMATREERHTTRGRAHLLFEMLRGDVISGWKDEHVKESLDLCLACKGCKGDCPVSVDIATHKAEFLSHYYEGRWRRPSAYALGMIFRWARLASRVPRLANALSQAPLIAGIAKSLGGFANQRPLPLFATQTFREWFLSRRPRSEGRNKVLLWPDTFNNYFKPHTALAAVEILEGAGRRVLIPDKPLCCGRPLYDYGMLEKAKQQLREILETLRPAIRQGIPVIGLEPSCVAVFRDELINLFPNDLDAQRLSRQSYLLSEYLAKSRDYAPPRLKGKAVVHGHCHQKAIMGMDAERKILSDMGMDFEILDTGCCGLAGSFGYEKEHYDISMKVGEQDVLPAVRRAPKDAFLLADGFSCRSQIEHGSDRRALHLAELLQLASQNGIQALNRRYPEATYIERPQPVSKKAIAAMIIAGGLLAASALRALTRSI